MEGVNKIKYFWINRNKDLLAKGKISWLEPSKIERQSILSSLIDAKKYIKGKILDVGCGNKPYKSIFEDVVEEYIGLDLPPPISTNVDADVFGNSLNLPFKSNVFDAVLSIQVLDDVPEPKKMMEETYRVLKNGGYLVLTAPLTWGLHDEPHDYYRYTKHGLKYLAESAGFEVIWIKERCGFWGMIGQKLSGYVYYWRGVPKSIIGEISKRSLCAIIQLIFCFLDHNKNKARSDTLGYILVAKNK